MVIQDRISDVEQKETSHHIALWECRQIETSDNAKVVRASLQSQPEVTVRVCRGVDHLTRSNNHLVAIDIITGEPVSPFEVAEAAYIVSERVPSRVLRPLTTSIESPNTNAPRSTSGHSQIERIQIRIHGLIPYRASAYRRRFLILAQFKGVERAQIDGDTPINIRGTGEEAVPSTSKSELRCRNAITGSHQLCKLRNISRIGGPEDATRFKVSFLAGVVAQLRIVVRQATWIGNASWQKRVCLLAETGLF